MNKYPHINMKHPKKSLMRREMAISCCTLLSNMGWWDRLRFCFSGNYWAPLQKTYDDIKLPDMKITEEKKRKK